MRTHELAKIMRKYKNVHHGDAEFTERANLVIPHNRIVIPSAARDLLLLSGFRLENF
jgi:hypothetical protein